ncbi:hypothetical protein [Dyadobacter tibetensis]|uniref:hypothetical protein n=1 Tax=Dyadobacter tibetensis TaxID=1211851 RepID=UPI0005C446ED|nr:hypothetical protein [Dyadobacter tibetensis]
MLTHLFDIKNDKRLSIYLYRSGFAMWLLYIVLGAPMADAYTHYRTECGVFSFILMILSFSVSMVYDYFHDPEAYKQKRKWLFITYFILAAVLYYFDVI